MHPVHWVKEVSFHPGKQLGCRHVHSHAGQSSVTLFRRVCGISAAASLEPAPAPSPSLTSPTVGKCSCFHQRDNPEGNRPALRASARPQQSLGRTQAFVIPVCRAECLPFCALLRNTHWKGQNKGLHSESSSVNFCLNPTSPKR